MPVLHFLYLPIDANVHADGYVFPTLDTDVAAISTLLTSKESQAAGDEDNDNHRNRLAAYDLLKKFHKEKNWLHILAWSHGVSHSGSRANYQDMSITKYRDKLSPILKGLTLKGEALPRAIFRTINMPKNDILTVTEFDMENVKVLSQSSGGLGVEDKLNENLCFDCIKSTETIYEINLILGKFVSQTFCAYDTNTQAVNRTMLSNTTKSLLELAKDKDKLKQTELVEDYELKDKEDNEEEESNHSLLGFAANKVNKKRKMLVSTEADSRKFRAVELTEDTRTRNGLCNAVATKFGVEVGKVTKVYQKCARLIKHAACCKMRKRCGKHSQRTIVKLR